MIEESNMPFAELDSSLGLVLVCQDGLGVGSMKFHSSRLLPLPHGCPGDGSSLSCGGKFLTISNGDRFHIRNLFRVIDLLSTTIALL
jgi:hypothetical protein